MSKSTNILRRSIVYKKAFNLYACLKSIVKMNNHRKQSFLTIPKRALKIVCQKRRYICNSKDLKVTLMKIFSGKMKISFLLFNLMR